jgi:glycerol-3-phosphate dehydrogenase (NAD(P)+)
MTIAVFGAGAWGTAVAIHLSRVGHQVTLVPRRLEHALALSKARENKDYLPGAPLPPSLQIGLEALPVMLEAEVILLACPVKGLKALCERLAQGLPEARSLKLVLTLCKGLDPQTGAMPVDVAKQWLPGVASGCLSGPTFADELAQGRPSAITLATDLPEAVDVQNAFSGPGLRVYLSRDIKGVEVAAALKNPYAIGAGLCDGLGLGYNARAAYLTRALAEMVRLVRALGGQAESAYGLSGFGDLCLTATGPQSRNRAFGEAVGKGEPIDELLSNRQTVVEGYPALLSFHNVAQKHQLEAPLLEALYKVIHEGASPGETLQQLMARPLKDETPAQAASTSA